MSQNQSAPASAAVLEPFSTPQGGSVGGPLRDRGSARSPDSLSGEYGSLCLFDDSDVLFDESENVRPDLENRRHAVGLNPGPCRSCIQHAAAASTPERETDGVLLEERVASLVSDSCAALPVSPDLFSP